MISKNRISQIRKLHAKKFRDEEGLFLVEGYKCVEMLCASDFVVEEIFATENAIRENKNWLKNREITTITAEEMSRISTMQTPPELLAIAQQRSEIHDIPEDKPILALDHISDPGNLGTIIRTADWFGIKKIVISEDTCDPWQPKVIQSTMGSIFRMQIIETDIVRFLKEVKTPVFGALMQGKNIYHTQIKDNQGVIIIGSESHGIRENVMPFVSCPINIPRAEGSQTESLNASVAAGIIISEVFRKNYR